jgi:DNA adenine methylase
VNLKAPFPWFGGKSRVADLVWARFGDAIPNYVEPFAGSLAVLLARDGTPRTETVNDKDAFLSNFWRALRADPDAVAAAADWPVSECDLLARHRWLVSCGDARLSMLKTDPDFFDAKIAGWWVWGLCSWIGSGWCRQRGDGDQPEQIPHLGNAGMGINRKLPHLGDAGRDVQNRAPGQSDDLYAYFHQLADRLKDVRICCGEWGRVLGDSVTIKHGMTGVFLDPPYSMEERSECYSVETDVSAAVRAWAIENGENPRLRIALCGYEGEHTMPASWECVAWKAAGGYGSQSEGRGRDNANRERIWFSPACVTTPALFDMATI